MLYTALTVVHVVVCTFLILVVLLQAGKGGGMGIAFGGGGSQTVFGSSGAGNFLTRLTAVCAALFFVNSMLLAYLSSKSDDRRLQALSHRNAVQKAAQQEELEKARREIEKAAGQSVAPATSGGTAAPTGAAPTGTAPEAPTGAAPAAPTGAAPAAPRSPRGPAEPKH